MFAKSICCVQFIQTRFKLNLSVDLERKKERVRIREKRKIGGRVGLILQQWYGFYFWISPIKSIIWNEVRTTTTAVAITSTIHTWIIIMANGLCSFSWIALCPVKWSIVCMWFAHTVGLKLQQDAELKHLQRSRIASKNYRVQWPLNAKNRYCNYTKHIQIRICTHAYAASRRYGLTVGTD